MKTREQWAEEVMDRACEYFTDLQIIKSRGNASQVEQHVLHDQNKALRALLLEVPDPEGWKLVPFEPTDKMRYAGMDESPLCIKRMYDSKNGEPKYTGTLHGFSTEAVGDIFKAMIKASPEYKDESCK